MLQKQLEDAASVRTTMHEQIADLTQQLKLEREDKQKIKKQLQVLETSSRRTSNAATVGAGGRRVSVDGGGGAAEIDALTQVSHSHITSFIMIFTSHF
jgi:hypothetical protein